MVGGRAGGWLPCVLSLITGGPPRAVAATIPSGELCRARVLPVCLGMSSAGVIIALPSGNLSRRTRDWRGGVGWWGCEGVE